MLFGASAAAIRALSTLAGLIAGLRLALSKRTLFPSGLSLS